jgi:hypothetical protein
MRVFISAALLLSCSGGDDSGHQALTINYQLAKRGMNVDCADAPEVAEVEVTLFGSNGITPRAGWPRKATCNGSFVAEDLDPGAYVLQVVALGELQGDPAAELYKARTDLTIPHEPLLLSLAPEVAFFDLAWTFGSDMLGPCTEVGSIDVLVAASGTPGFSGRFDCDATPIQIETPFTLQSYAVQVIANSADGFPLFTSDARVTFDRGLNEYTAVLSPLGGQVQIDFNFFTRNTTTRMCDDPDVDATDLTATIVSLEGGDTVMETFGCMETRPHAFSSARFTQGRMLQLEVVADAAERFKGIQIFTMPADDYFTGVMTLVPVGDATVIAEVRSSTCAGTVDRFDVTVVPSAEPNIAFASSIMPPDDRVDITDLPFGEYRVSVQEFVGGAEKCSVEGVRIISARTNVWDPFVF